MRNVALVNHVVSSAVVFDDTWHHIAWVDDRGTVKLYVDGDLDAANFNYTPSGTFTLTHELHRHASPVRSCHRKYFQRPHRRRRPLETRVEPGGSR